MLKALLKKQFLETASFFFIGRKSGKKLSKLGVLGILLLLAYATGGVGFMMWELSKTLCAPLVQAGLSWVYFAFVATIATGLGVLGSVFATKSKVYEAKDNDFLLSLPLKPWAVLFSRVLPLYLMTLFFQSLVLLPAFAQYFILVGVQIPLLLCALVVLFALPLGALALCLLLGWLVALVTARIRSKNLLTLLFTTVFLVAYFLIIGKINEYLTFVILHGEAVGQTMKTSLFPLYLAGLACVGDGVGLLGFLAVFGGVFALSYFVLSKTFLRVVTVKRGAKKRVYREKAGKSSSVFFALFKRESTRIFKNLMLLLNGGIGVVLLLILCIVAPFNMELIRQINASPIPKDEVASILVSILCFIASSTVFTASSVSLEGETLWILRSSPVKTEQIFKAKTAFHLAIAFPPALVGAIELCALLKIPALTCLCILLTLFALCFLCAKFGLFVNLKFPNLHWTNEITAVKQSVSTLLATFFGWGASALFVGGWFLFGQGLGIRIYLLLCSLVFASFGVMLYLWERKKGKTVFENL
ncbi:MAG: hypothetical protein E7381_05200 [Clostridiales bacterium]|nr:hypothetical protein [Clostridiales bacterium]